MCAVYFISPKGVTKTIALATGLLVRWRFFSNQLLGLTGTLDGASIDGASSVQEQTEYGMGMDQKLFQEAR
jgi:hypothetical protein